MWLFGQHGLGDLPHGCGTFLRADESVVYVGEWVRGVRQGRGVFHWANGNHWDGVFKDDSLHGYGVWHGYAANHVNQIRGKQLSHRGGHACAQLTGGGRSGQSTVANGY